MKRVILHPSSFILYHYRMNFNQMRMPLLLSIAASLLTMAVKFGAYWLTDSAGLFSDAMESLANLLASSTALACLWYAFQPADISHTYGHEKIEYFSSGLEGMLILSASAGIAWFAIQRLLFPREIHELGIGTALSMGASLVNLAVGQVLLRTGRKHGSIILEADGQHLLTDVWTSVGVVAGLFFVWITGLEVLDPLIALGVAANIVWTSLHLLRRSFNGLMDHALPPGEQERVRQAIEMLLPPGYHYHALRTRQAGTRRFADFHLLVPGAWSVKEAHDLSVQIETAVRAALSGIETTVHIEPLEEEASWRDSALLPLEREQK